MIRKVLLSLLAALICYSADAQVAKWLINPEFDSITINNIGLLEVTKNKKVGLYDRNGNELIAIEYDDIHPFYEGYALLFNNNQFVGFANEDGKIVDLSTMGFQLKEGADRFSCGRLLVYNTNRQGDIYRFIDTEGNPINGVYLSANPFIEGYASVETPIYDSDPIEAQPDMIDVNGIPVTFGNEKKSNVQFISSFRDGTAIAIIKNKFYTVHTDDFTPVQMYTDSLMNNKSKIVSEYSVVDKRDMGDGRVLVKARNAVFIFNQHNQLNEYKYDNYEPVKHPVKEEMSRTIPASHFTITEENELYGMLYNGDTLLPPQFEEVIATEDNIAIVRTNGKFGVVTVDPKSQITFTINDGEHVPFRHDTQVITLKANLPKFIQQAEIISCSEDCSIDYSTYNDGVRNIRGYFPSCNCNIKIPQDITETPLEHTYEFRLNYDGLISKTIPVNVQEWYVKYYTVNVKTKEMQVSTHNDAITIEIEVVKSETVYDSRTYYKDVEILQINEDGTTTKLISNQINDILYTFTLSYEEITTPAIKFIILLTETGCPTMEYPYIIRFNLPEKSDETSSEPQTITATVEAGQNSSTISQRVSITTKSTDVEMLTEVESSITVNNNK